MNERPQRIESFRNRRLGGKTISPKKTERDIIHFRNTWETPGSVVQGSETKYTVGEMSVIHPLLARRCAVHPFQERPCPLSDDPCSIALRWYHTNYTAFSIEKSQVHGHCHTITERCNNDRLSGTVSSASNGLPPQKRLTVKIAPTIEYPAQQWDAWPKSLHMIIYYFVIVLGM